MKQKLTDFVKKETVLVIAAILAVLSAFAVPPGSELSFLYRLEGTWHPVIAYVNYSGITEKWGI